MGADFVVSAAGPQTGHICDMVGAFVPVSPGRVEIVVTEPLPLMPIGKITGHGIYGRQTRRGNLTYGGGNQEWIDVGLGSPDKPNTPMIRNIAKRLCELYPAAEDLRIRRPADHAKLGGRGRADAGHGSSRGHPGPPGQLRRRDHVGADGFGISPATGKVVSDLVLHGESPELLGDLGLNRFRDVPRDWRERWGWAPPAEVE